MANYGGIDQNYFLSTVDANTGNELFNSTKGQEGITRVPYSTSGKDGNQMLDVLANDRHR